MGQKVIMQETSANERIVQILLEQDELTWQTLIYELVKTEQMDPWNVDVSKLANSFLEMIRTLQEMDFRITGKLVLAAALLLKIKSNRFLEEDITALDSLISGAEEEAIELLDELPMPYDLEGKKKKESHELIPRTPQPRKRKVSVSDLIEALEKALEVEIRRVPAVKEVEVEVPVKNIDLSKVIMDVYKEVHTHYRNNDETLSFSNLLPENASKEDKVFTFIPLLHLDHQGNIDLTQEESFGEILIEFLKEIEGPIQIEEGDLGSA